jgi:Na+-driven multidrug efflux pump
MLIVIGSVIGVFLIFTLAGSGTSNGVFTSSSNQEDTSTGSLTRLLSVFIPLGLIVFFALTGIIPEWVIILMVVLTAGFVALFFRRQVIGGN